MTPSTLIQKVSANKHGGSFRRQTEQVGPEKTGPQRSPVARSGSVKKDRVRDVAWLPRLLMKWHSVVVRDFPWRSSTDPFHILVAEILLQATYSGKVAPIYESIINIYPTPAALVKADIPALQTLIRPLGLQKRAMTLVALASSIERDHKGLVPHDEESLCELPGVGPYTAAAVSAFAFGMHTAAIDTNGVRVLQRFYNLPPPPAGYRGVVGPDVRRLALRLVPMRRSRSFNLALIDLGALVCTARKPKCGSCPVALRCAYALKAETAGSN